MANRFWVGGTNTWNTTVGTKWSTTSGGAGGAAVPTATDDVFFDATSGAASVVTLTGALVCKSITTTGFTGTLTGTGTLTVSGDITFNAGTTYSHTGAITINAASTITSAGKTLGALTLNAPGVAIALVGSLTVAGALLHTAGNISWLGNAVTCARFNSSNTNARTLIASGVWNILGSASGSQDAWVITTSTNLTADFTGSRIVLANTSSTRKAFAGGAQVYNEVEFTGGGGAGHYAINQNNTFRKLTFAAGIIVEMTAGTVQTLQTPLVAVGTAGNLIALLSTIAGAVWALVCAGGDVKCDYLSVTDAWVLGGARWWAGRHSVNGGGNANGGGWRFADYGPRRSPLRFQVAA